MMRAFTRATHPEPTVAVTAMASAYAATRGASWRKSATIGVAVLCGQLSVGWQNDTIDEDRDREAGRLDKPLVAGTIHASDLRNAAVTATLACLPVSLLPGRRFALRHLAALGAAWSYNAGLKATPLSVVPYCGAFPLLVEAIAAATPESGPAPPWLLCGTAILAAGAHLANAYPDIEADLTLGVKGLPQRLGPRASLAGAVGLLGVATVIYAFGDGQPRRTALYGIAAVAGMLGYGTKAAARRGRRVWFKVAMAIATIDVALLVASRRTATQTSPAP